MRAVRAAIIAAAILTAACATVPKEAVTLSVVVGTRLGEMQALHEKAVTSYFAVTRERIEGFIDDRWTPEFLGVFVKDSDLTNRLAGVKPLSDEQTKDIAAELDKAGVAKASQPAIIGAVNSAFGNPDRGRLVLQFSQAAVLQIEAKRKTLLDPVNAMEKRAITELRAAYAQLIQAQNTVTGHLNSVQKVTESQDKALQQLGLLQKRDEIIDGALKTNDEIVGLLNTGKGALEVVKQLESKLGAQAAP